jgi:hypothetical protein
MGGHFKIQDGCLYQVNTDHNGFIDPVNMGLDTNIKTTCASHTEIWAKNNLIDGHLQI